MTMLKTLCASLVVSLVAFAGEATVVTKEGVGEAAVIGKDELKAFEEAKNNALRAAVEAAAGVRIDADTVVVNNQLVRDQVFANTSGYVKKFEILEKKSEKGVATVKVKADIITENLDKDITAARDLVKRMGRPSLVVVIQEQTLQADGKGVSSSESLATALTAAFKADGWLIKDEQAINKKLKLEGAITVGATQAKEIADLAKADFILYGKASVRNEPSPEMTKNSPIFFISGEYDLAVASTDSEEQLTKVAGALRMSPKTKETSVSYERTAFNVIEERKAEIIAPVRKAVLEHFRDQQVNGKAITLSVKGLESFTAAKDFKKAIETMKGIKDATQDNFADGKAAYRITFLGSAGDFAELIESSTFKKKKLLVLSQTPSTLEVQVGK